MAHALLAQSMKDKFVLVFKVFSIILVIELIIMLMLSGFELKSVNLLEALVDAMLLALLSTPIIIAVIKGYISKWEELTILVNNSQKLSETMDLEIVLQTVIDNTTNINQLNTGALYLINGDNLYLAATTPALPTGFPDHLRQGNIHDHPHLKKAVTNYEPVIITDTSSVDLSPSEQQVVQQRGLTSLLFIPLHVKDKSIGVLILGTTDIKRTFSASEVGVYTALANHAALAITNADLYQRIQKHADELEEKVAQRTDELNQANQQLHKEIREHEKTEMLLAEAKKKAEIANELKGSFLANMSHEIRTPMNVIMGMTELALRTDLTDKQRNYLSKVSYSAGNLLRIINDILDFSKIESGNIDFELRAFNLPKLLSHIKNSTSVMVRDKHLEVKLNIEEAIPDNLVGDSLRLSQVVTNLLSNAIKFSDSGETVTMNVAMKEENDSEVVLRFDITDHGIGIEADKIEKIFLDFSQADSSTTRKYGGTGLGLSISKQLVQMMGGKIWVESTPREGSTFSFTVTLQRAEAKDLSVQHVDLDDASVVMVPDFLRGAEVLVAEDDEINQELIVECLSDYGINVTVANNGQEVLNCLEEKEFDCVLMDCQMPIMDGFEATRKIRAEEKYKDLHIIALTGNALAGDRDKVHKAGMNHYFSKPYDFDELTSYLAKVLKHKKLHL